MTRFTEIPSSLLLGCDLTRLIDSGGELVLDLSDASGGSASVRFPSYFAYRKLDEGDALRTLAAIRESGVTRSAIYIVDDSDFLQWFEEESFGVRSGQVIRHYSVHTANDVVDVLSSEDPLI